MNAGPQKVVNYLTIDFEDWYQGLTSTSRNYERWQEYEKRIGIGSGWLLQTLAAEGIKATFFIVGKVAQEHQDIVTAIAAAGHEIGLHGTLHKPVWSMTREGFRADLQLNMKVVQEIAGKQAVGFRAPYFSIHQELDWFWEVIAEAGLIFDSSVFPIKTPLYGMPRGKRFPYLVETRYGVVHEFPVSTCRIAGINLPFSGGFYFRILPYGVIRFLTAQENKRNTPVLFYFHPWEFDPSHPQPRTISRFERLTHYGFLNGNREKFKRLLKDFSFGALGSRGRRT